MMAYGGVGEQLHSLVIPELEEEWMAPKTEVPYLRAESLCTQRIRG